MASTSFCSNGHPTIMFNGSLCPICFPTEKESIVSNDQAIEQEIKAKGLTAPRITPADIEANIKDEHYFTAGNGFLGARGLGQGVYPTALGLLTFCVLELQNGFTVTGESACASPENFDAELGRKIARQNAMQKLWPLMGYELKERLHLASISKAEAEKKGEVKA